MDFSPVAFRPCDMLLPAPGTDLTRWACVACDQYTSEPEYWQQVEKLVGEAPSTLRLMLPEVYLPESSSRVPRIHQSMMDAINNGILTQQVTDAFVLVERTTAAGTRTGLIGCVDLEQYSFEAGAASLIRPTEQTVRSRLPARAAIRRGAPLEMTHIMMLMNDPERTVIEPLRARKTTLRPLYDFDLMQNGGHLAGWAVESETDKQLILSALTALKNAAGEDALLFAVGDGNHSLATAKTCWEELKPTLTEAERESHPARYALVEIENIHDEALLFEPIHRVVDHVDADALLGIWMTYCYTHGESLMLGSGDGHRFTFVRNDERVPSTIVHPSDALEAETIQKFLDSYLAEHPDSGIDYIHGDEVIMRLCAADPNTIGILLPALDKSKFFDLLDEIGVMPRKTFSLGEANEKRFYMECRRIL